MKIGLIRLRLLVFRPLALGLTAHGLLALGCLAPIQAQTVDFESPAYLSGNTFLDIDSWTKSTEIPAPSPDNYKIQGALGNKWATVQTHSTGSIYRNFPDRPGTIDLRWRWRANGDSVRLCMGISGNSGSSKISSRALACINPEGLFEGQGQISVTSNEGWIKQTWYYMHMTLDANTNKYALYIATDSLRLDERIALPTSSMNGVGPLSRIFLRTENGDGLVDIDDITWESLAYWVGEMDSLGSNGKNWNPAGVPDSLTHVIFNENSSLNFFVDKPIAIKSITVPTTWKGSINLGTSILTLLGKTDLTGGKYFFQAGGLIRLASPKSQNLMGPEPGKSGPPIRHDGNGVLRIDARPLYVASFHQAKGRLDFNGQDFVVATDFSVTHGQPGTLINLDGRALSIGKSARLEGSSSDTLLGLVSTPKLGGVAKGWSIAVNVTDTLQTKFAVIGNARASVGTGYAYVSSDAGNNTGWIFVTPPAIQTAPKDQTVKIGETAIFRISVSSKLPVTYQWLRNDIDIPNAKDSVYYFVAAKLSDNGSAFSCKVSSVGGSVSSPPAKLKVDFLAPTVLPPPQGFSESLALILSPSMVGAKVYYSKNGSPFAEFTTSLLLTDSTLLKAFAVLGTDTSAMGQWIYPKYQLPLTETPFISPDPLTFIDSQKVSMAPATPGSIIYYTTDQTDPDSGKIRYSTPFIIKVTTTVRARAYLAGNRPSSIRSNIYLKKSSDTTTVLGKPQASPPSGSFADSLSILLLPPTNTPTAVMYYTFNGSALLKYNGAITLRESGTLKVIAIKGSSFSDTAFFAYTRQLEAPSATPKGSNFPDTIRISLTTKVPGSLIYYTLDGTDPTAKSKPFTVASITLDSSTTLKAIAIKGTDISAIMTETYRLIANAPQATYLSGDYSSKIQIGLSTTSERAVIYYTLDGSTPGPETGRQPYTSPFWLDTTATLKAIAVTGHGLTLQKSPLLIENYTFIVPGRRLLGPGQKLEISSNYSLTSTQTGSSSVIVDVLRVDSLTSLKGFRDIQFAMRLSLPDGSTAFPSIVFTSPTGETRSLYSLISQNTVNYITDVDAYEIQNPGTYFMAVDTLPPQITLSGESFGAEDSTKAVFSIQDNVSNLILNLERTDIPARNIVNKPITSPEIVSPVMRNPLGSIQPLTLRIKVDDHHQQASFPPEPNTYHFLAQKNSGPVRTPSLFQIGNSPTNPWDLISLPLAVDPPLTLAQLRKNNTSNGLAAVTWDATAGKYRYLKDNEALLPGAAYWFAAPTSMASMVFPSLQTQTQKGSGKFKITLHKGWNQVANPTLSTLFWPVTREIPELYDLSQLKGLHTYDPKIEDYVHIDSLVPWRGYFVNYKGNRDTTIELLFEPPAMQAALSRLAKTSASEGISLTLKLDRLSVLRLGASVQAQDGFGYEDESRPPSQNEKRSQLWSARERQHLETDILHWVSGSIYTWHVVAHPASPSSQSNLEVEKTLGPEDEPSISSTKVGSLILPTGYAAWAVSRTRGLRFRLQEDFSLPMQAGQMDSLDIFAGPALELESRLAAIPQSVPDFQINISTLPGCFSLKVKLPVAMQIHWALWALDGRQSESGLVNLSEGIYSINSRNRRLSRGMYVISMDWVGKGGKTGANLVGHLTRKLLIP